jgi:phage antirepressor YoqD-like protein
LSAVVDETHAVAQKILFRLVARPMRVRDIWKLTVQDSVGVDKAVRVFYWLRDKGYIEKTGTDYCAPYKVTEKGLMFYGAIV